MDYPVNMGDFFLHAYGDYACVPNVKPPKNIVWFSY